MMYLIYNNDGSFLTKILGESIQQGNNGVNQIFVAIVDENGNSWSTSNWTCVANFTLPDDTITQLSGVATSSVKVGEKYYDGYTITLTSAQTVYAGKLTMSLSLYDIDDNVLWTYQYAFTVNPTDYDADETTITVAQYNALISTLNSYLLKEDATTYILEYLEDYYTSDEVDSLLNSYVDLTSAQSISGAKTFTGSITFNSMFGDSIYGDDELYLTSGGESAYITLKDGDEGAEIYGESLAKIGSANGNISIWDDGVIDIDGLEVDIKTDTNISGRVTFTLGYFYGANQQQLYLPTESGMLATRDFVNTAVSTKQNVLTAGAGISITGNTISANAVIGLDGPYASLAALQSAVPVGASNIIYFVTNAGSVSGNLYDEYIWNTNNNSYEMIGTVSSSVDLTNYYNKTEIDNKLDDYVDLTSAQTITGEKTFNNSIIFKNTSANYAWAILESEDSELDFLFDDEVQVSFKNHSIEIQNLDINGVIRKDGYSYTLPSATGTLGLKTYVHNLEIIATDTSTYPYDRYRLRFISTDPTAITDSNFSNLVSDFANKIVSGFGQTWTSVGSNTTIGIIYTYYAPGGSTDGIGIISSSGGLYYITKSSITGGTYTCSDTVTEL